ncbi:MAG TPA: hypothetical protein VN845_12945 [Solirubrobacteraceae bacterium]|nr:hypothetical protein [Solirubrobacteraceae bacterium]
MDQEVAKTLSELELKLQELERELTSLGREQPARSGHVATRLVDEAVERDRASDGGAAQRIAEEAVADGDGFGGPAVWGGEEVPAQAGASSERDWSAGVRETAYGEIPIPPPRVLDEAQAPISPISPGSAHVPAAPYAPNPAHTHMQGHVPATQPASTAHYAQDPAPHTPGPTHTHAPLPQPPSMPQPLEVAELDRFKEKLRRTMEDLIDECSRLLSPKPPA